ncbi:MAG TPA: hypothetical protein VFP49_06070 [Nitrososphaeraceae archaeon]|nr:hypothetical protein [Nitrososphaeraceae archaeon]
MLYKDCNWKISSKENLPLKLQEREYGNARKPLGKIVMECKAIRVLIHKPFLYCIFLFNDFP